jgi:hypothetical protein
MLGPWSPNKSSLYDVKQNRRKAKSLPQTCFLANEPNEPVTGIGGAGRDRTDDPLLAKQVLSQLSYGP